MDKDFLELEKKHEELIKEFDNYAYIVSHDLNSSIRHIREFSRLLLEELEPHLTDDVKEYKGFIDSSVRQIEQKMSLLLEFSRTNTLKPTYLDIDSNVLFELAVQELLKTEKFKINYNGTFPSIHIDVEMFQKVIIFLLENAVKFQPNKNIPTIDISANEEDPLFFTFLIKDYGLGIPNDKLEEVFYLFRKLSNDFEGDGVGLTIARKIIHRLGGEITLASKLSEGTEIRISIPR